MKVRDILGLVIRVVGVYFLIKALHAGVGFVGRLADRQELSLITAAYFVLYVLLGLYCLRGAPELLKWAYPENSGSQKNDAAGDTKTP